MSEFIKFHQSTHNIYIYNDNISKYILIWKPNLQILIKLDL